MCKVLAIAGVKPEKQKMMWDFILAVTPIITNHDADGVGYAAQSSKGLFGERWLNPKDAWTLKKSHPDYESKIIEEYKGVLSAPPRYSNFGPNDGAKTAHAIILHARMATCAKNIANTHPFVSEDGKTALIHNGVISNVTALKQKTSTCDSECILNAYVDKDVSNDPDKIEKVASLLRGNYACPVLTEASDGTKYLDIFKSKTTNLIGTFIPALDAMVFCTNLQIVMDACKELKWRFRTCFTFGAEEMVRINSVTGAVVSTHKFTEESSYSYGGFNHRSTFRPYSEGMEWIGGKWEYPEDTKALTTTKDDMSDVLKPYDNKRLSELNDEEAKLKDAKAEGIICDIKKETDALIKGAVADVLAETADPTLTDEEQALFEKEVLERVEKEIAKLDIGTEGDNQELLEMKRSGSAC